MEKLRTPQRFFSGRAEQGLFLAKNGLVRVRLKRLRARKDRGHVLPVSYFTISVFSIFNALPALRRGKSARGDRQKGKKKPKKARENLEAMPRGNEKCAPLFGKNARNHVLFPINSAHTSFNLTAPSLERGHRKANRMCAHAAK